MEISGSSSHVGDEKKRLQNRMAQRRHRLKLRMRQSNPILDENRHSSPFASWGEPSCPSALKRLMPSRSPSSAYKGSEPSDEVSGKNFTHYPFLSSDNRLSPNNNQPPVAPRSTQHHPPCDEPGDLMSLTDAVSNLFQEEPFTSLPTEPGLLTPEWSGSSMPTPSLDPSWEVMKPAVTYSSTAGTMSPNDAKNGRLSAVDLEDGLEGILDSVFKAGYDTIEAMMISYYTLDFDENSTIGQAQRLSRTRHIRGLISALGEKSKRWSQDEKGPFREEILKLAETLYAAEVQHIRSIQGQDATGLPEWLDDLRLRQSDAGAQMRMLRDLHCDIPELWSLFTALVQQLGILPSMRRKAVCLIITLLCRLTA